MEKIINNPGLQHLVEKVFWSLDYKNLKICAEINQSSQQTVKNPIFWLKKFKSFSNDWIKVIQSVKNTDKEKYIISYLNWKFKQGIVEYLPCYTSLAVQDDFRKKIYEICTQLVSKLLSTEDIEIVKLYVPLLDNPNAPNGNVYTPIYIAAFNEHTHRNCQNLGSFDRQSYPNAPNKYICTDSNL